MKRLGKLSTLFAAAFSLLSVSAYASDITVFDHNSGPCAVGNCEDNETEPGTVPSQPWDLEKMTFDGRNLSIMGGFDFKNGAPGYTYYSGDIFIDTNGDALYGVNGSGWTQGAPVFNGENNAHWDYAIRLNFTNNKYFVFSLEPDTPMQNVIYIGGSQPWKVNLGVSDWSNAQSFTYGSYSDPSLLAWGGNNTHYMIGGFDLQAIIGANQAFTAKFTMECGNDEIVGQGVTATPEPTSLALLGFGLVGLAGAARKSNRLRHP